MDPQRPKIRSCVEAFPAQDRGRQVLVLHDRLGISPDLILDPSTAVILSLMDGRRDLRDIQVTLMRRAGLGLVPLERLQDFVTRLDESLFLDNERFSRRKEEISLEFQRQGVRLPAHAGSAYPADPGEIRLKLSESFQAAGPARQHPGSIPAGLVLPHIDLNRGARCYAKGYEALGASIRDVNLFVILGTSHLPMELPFALTTKNFQTPLGELSCEGQLAERLCEEAETDFFRDELVHRVEHSIEIQLVFLQHLFGDAPYRFRILPVLCGGFHELIEKRLLPTGHPPTARGLMALGKLIQEYPGRVCVMASADLAHLGPQFGDPAPVQMSDLGRIMREDLDMLEWVQKGNADGFFRHIMAQGDRRRICGLPPIYAWSYLMRGKTVRLIHYDQAYQPHCTVTFASLGAW